MQDSAANFTAYDTCMQCENKYGNKLHSTRRISSHDFFARLEVIADVMLESSARDAALTADAILILSVSYLPTNSTHRLQQQTQHIFQDTSINFWEKVKSVAYSNIHLMCKLSDQHQFMPTPISVKIGMIQKHGYKIKRMKLDKLHVSFNQYITVFFAI